MRQMQIITAVLVTLLQPGLCSDDIDASPMMDEATAIKLLQGIGVRVVQNPSGVVLGIETSAVGEAFKDEHMLYVRAVRSAEYVNLSQTSVTDIGLTVLAGMPCLKTLSLPAKVTPVGLRSLKQLPALEGLFTRPLHASPETLAEINQLTNLRALSVWWTEEHSDQDLMRLRDLDNLWKPPLPPGLTDDGLASLKEFANVSRLELGRCTKITDDGLRHIRELPSVNTIDFPPQITDTGLRYLHGVQGIRSIGLYRTQVTNDGLVYLQDNPDLRFLILPPSITDEGVRHLHKCTKLSVVDCFGNNISEEAIKALKEQIPHVKLTIRPGPDKSRHHRP